MPRPLGRHLCSDSNWDLLAAVKTTAVHQMSLHKFTLSDGLQANDTIGAGAIYACAPQGSNGASGIYICAYTRLAYMRLASRDLRAASIVLAPQWNAVAKRERERALSRSLFIRCKTARTSRCPLSWPRPTRGKSKLIDLPEVARVSGHGKS